MPLVERSDSLLVVVDTQPGFYGHDGLSEEESGRAAATVVRIAWLAGMASRSASRRS